MSHKQTKTKRSSVRETRNPKLKTQPPPGPVCSVGPVCSRSFNVGSVCERAARQAENPQLRTYAYVYQTSDRPCQRLELETRSLKLETQLGRISLALPFFSPGELSGLADYLERRAASRIQLLPQRPESGLPKRAHIRFPSRASG